MSMYTRVTQRPQQTEKLKIIPPSQSEYRTRHRRTFHPIPKRLTPPPRAQTSHRRPGRRGGSRISIGFLGKLPRSLSENSRPESPRIIPSPAERTAITTSHLALQSRFNKSMTCFSSPYYTAPEMDQHDNANLPADLKTTTHPNPPAIGSVPTGTGSAACTINPSCSRRYLCRFDRRTGQDRRMFRRSR